MVSYQIVFGELLFLVNIITYINEQLLNVVKITLKFTLKYTYCRQVNNIIAQIFNVVMTHIRVAIYRI